MAIMAYLLQEYSNEKIDVAKVMLMCLIHDVVEIEAGDTYAYDEEAKKTQKAREDAAKEKIYSMLPDDQKLSLTALFDEFEAGETPEARFARAMDNLQPLLLNHSNGGSDWLEHHVSAKQVYERQQRTRYGSEKLFEVTDSILQQPLLLNHSNGGSDWLEHHVSAKQVYERQQRTRYGSEKLFEVTDSILQENIQKGVLKK